MCGAQVRPEFYRNKATTHKKGFYTANAGFMPVGEHYSPYFPKSARAGRFARAGFVTLFMMSIVFIGTLAIMAFRLSLAASNSFLTTTDPETGDTVPVVCPRSCPGHSSPTPCICHQCTLLTTCTVCVSVSQELPFGLKPALVATIIGSLLNTVFIVVMNVIYRKLGLMMTVWENHRTDS